MTPDFIRDSSVWGPVFAVGVLLGLILVAAVVQLVFQIALKRRRATAPDALDTLIVEAIRGPAVLFIMILGLSLSFLVLTSLTSPAYESLRGLAEWARRAWVIVVVAEVSYLASHLAQVLLAWYVREIAVRTSTDLDTKLLPPIRRVLPITIYSAGALVALQILEVPISPLLAGFGIGGLAVALAVQPTLSNFFSGTYLVTEGELNEGDFIEIEGWPSGYVVDVGWRSTKIRSRFNTNYYTPTPALNVIVTGGVSYDSDLAHVDRVVAEVAQQTVDESDVAVKDSEPFFGFSEFGDSNIDFWVFVQAIDRTGSFTLKSDLVKRIHSRFR